MASTNKTTHYNLNQYIGTDKPTYLVDYNQDMERIDTGIYGADSKATLNFSSIGTLSNLTTTAKTDLVSAVNEVNSSAVGVGDISQLTTSDKTSVVAAVNEVDGDVGNLMSLNTANKTSIVAAVNEVDGDVGNLANLTTQTQTSLVGAVNEVKALIENFNLSTYETISNATLTNGNFESYNISLAKNADGSIAKIYGRLLINGLTASSSTISFNTSLRPESDITINCAGFYRQYNIANAWAMIPNYADLTIKTTGECSIIIYLYQGTTTNCDVFLLPYLYFIKDFGDTPSPQI